MFAAAVLVLMLVMAWLTSWFVTRMIAAFMAVNTYLIDAFTLYAASAMAANTILRSVRRHNHSLILLADADFADIEAQILGGVFPLFGLQMYNALGLVSGNRSCRLRK